MRIRFIHTFMYPDMSAVSQLMSDVAFHLAGEGHDVDVVAGRGTYEGKGERLSKSETIRGVKFRRIWSPNLGKGSMVARLLDLCAFTLGSFLYALFARRVDRVVLLTNPPMYAAAGIFLRMLRHEPYVYVVMDLFPDVAECAGLMKPKGILSRIARGITCATFKRAERIVVLGTCMADRVRQYGISDEKIAIIRNWSDGEAIRPLAAEVNPLRKELGLTDEFIVMYSGNMGVGHRFEDILAAALNLRDRSDIRFLFVGNGVRRKEVEAFRDAHGLDNVTVRGYFPREDLCDSLPLGDAHFVSLRNGYEGLIVPSKTYGIMAAGRPVIYQGNRTGEIARMLLEDGGGAVVDEGDAAGLEDIITRWADNRADAGAQGKRARELFEERYTEKTGMQLYQAVLEGKQI